MSNEIISYQEMCATEKASLQRGMNFRIHPKYSLVLMSTRRNAPYADRIEDDGRTLIYEGHDHPRSPEVPNPKSVDQPLKLASGRLTQNGLFFQAAKDYQAGLRTAEPVRVYEKVRSGIWTYNGLFRLTDASQEFDGSRNVCKFRLEIDEHESEPTSGDTEIEHSRVIPSSVKLEVWQRDGGKCVQCGASDNLHFDHIIPYSKGGTSLRKENIQLLCARHNLEKRDRIE